MSLRSKSKSLTLSLKHSGYFRLAQYSRYPSRFGGAYRLNRTEIPLEHMFEQKQKCIEGLVLCRRGNVAIDSKVGEMGFHVLARYGIKISKRFKVNTIRFE